jgi:hypothetical protein
VLYAEIVDDQVRYLSGGVFPFATDDINVTAVFGWWLDKKMQDLSLPVV